MSLKDLKIQAFTEPVSDLPDNPSQSGITAEELKRRFDANANNELKPSVNGIVDFLLGFTNGEEIKGIRLNEGNVVEVTKDGANYISTGYSKAYITQLLAEKVDKSDVLLKTNTEEFTPTGIYQPATKKYVDDKVVASGAADMTQAVYDPTGRQTDIFAEVDKKLDKSGGTLSGNLSIKNGSAKFSEHDGVVHIEAINTDSEQADRRYLEIRNFQDEDIGISLKFLEEKDGDIYEFNVFGEHNLNIMERSVLPRSGGKLTGDLEIESSSPQFYMRNTGTDRYYHILVSSDKNIYFRNATDTNNRTAFYLQPETGEKLERLFRLQKVVNGTSSLYNVYGQHNKPSGSYTGNGSTSARTVQVGGSGDVLLVRQGKMCYFVTPEGVTYSTGGAANTTYTITFIDGVLTIPGESNLNNSGQAYYYQVL